MPIPNALHDLDVRLQHRNLRSGKITPEQVQAHLDSLPDDAEHAVEVDTRFQHRHDDGDAELLPEEDLD